MRPSAVLGIRSAWLAYDFDDAVFRFGAWAMGRMQERDKDYKLRYTPEEALGIPKRLPEPTPIDPRMLGAALSPYGAVTRKPGRIQKAEVAHGD